ncbi:MAG TPA: DsbA family protein [Solirubrobacteraceae bacterium]|jgi:2-hydroxychromene-2-carboxylate isomerase|nr:DsbA family protein [Solirubrobacteraceae bacterium]
MQPPRFFFGAMSPYAWFAAERIDGLLPNAAWHCVFLGAIFKDNGRVSWGMTDRRASGMEDCEARAAAHGLGPIRWPQPWPTNDLLIGRAMAFAEARGKLKPFALAAMRLSFLEGADLAELASVLEAGRRVGIGETEMQSALGDREIKDALRRTTGEALALGVFGVPTVAVGGELFWGDDRLGDAADASSRLIDR